MHVSQTIGGSPVIQGIIFSAPGELSRTVVSRSRARSTGKYPGYKTRRSMQFESMHERNAFRLLDCMPKVVSFREQPCEIRFMMDGLMRKHFPDILVHYKQELEFWEIKTASEAARPEISLRTDILMQSLPSWGYGYRLILAEDLAAKPRSQNLDLLLRFGRAAVDYAQKEQFLKSLHRTQTVSWKEACGSEWGTHGRNTLCHLVLEGELEYDHSSLISASTTFSCKWGVR
jgi:hypothetical protein